MAETSFYQNILETYNLQEENNVFRTRDFQPDFPEFFPPWIGVSTGLSHERRFWDTGSALVN